jgi:phenylalanyl-tRNA synthetase beta chain
VRAPLSWIREFTPVAAPVPELVYALNQLGLEVEGLEEPGREIAGVIAAKVLAVADHPDADKLTLVEIDTGGATTRVVCGARNLAPGDVVPYAPPGARLPSGVLERRKIRGVVSDGMLCSPRELGLGHDHQGILHLASGSILGTDVREVLGLDDVVFDLAITANRPDAMSVIGIARDLAAHFGLPLTVPEPSVPSAGRPTADRVTLEVEAPDRCPRYVARVATVVMGASPDWMARRLTLAGMRPISNVVDVTNYVLLERGQPLHAFDLVRLGGRGILVRLAADAERMQTLDDVERVLTPDDLLICDAEGAPQAIAGIMGGGSSEVSDATTEILLESAYFEPMGISRTSKRLELRSESSARFERGVDPGGVLAGADRACELLRDVAGAEAAPDALDAYPHPVERRRITVRTDRINALLGTTLSGEEVGAALEPLGIELEGGGGAPIAVVPTYRPDIEREVDLAEEVARRVGFNEIPRTIPSSPDHVGGLTRAQRERRLVADVLVGAGCSEAYTLSLVAPTDLSRVELAALAVVAVENPLRAEESLLRPRILPGLLGAVAFNAGHGRPGVALFEMGHVFGVPPDGQVLPDERDHVAVALAGAVPRRPHEPDRPVDVYDVVDVWEQLVDALELADARLERANAPGLHPARTAAAVVDGEVLGHAGELAPAVAAAFELAEPVVVLELDLGRLLGASRRERLFKPVSRFPASGIDLAFVVAENVAAGGVEATLRAAAGELLEDVRLFDVFRSDALGPGRKSLAYALRFRAPDRTLTDEEVGGLRQRCIGAVVAEHGGELRA